MIGWRIGAAMAAVMGGLMVTSAGAVAGGVLQDEGLQLTLGAGGYDVLHDYTAGIVRAEVKFPTFLPFDVRPILGGELTSDSALYGYGGFALDLFITDHWILTPEAAVGAYDRGSGKQLGSWVEFRTGAELNYKFEDDARLGFSFHHISNAGLTRHNPGEEEMLVLYTLPISR